jgi:hypothetical protein
MSRRVRNNSGTAEEAHPAGSRAGPVELSVASWNATFQGFSADDRARILELAFPTGFVYAQQLPDPKQTRRAEEAGASLFASFLNGPTHRLAPAVSTSLLFVDAQLDHWQKEAVAKALVTPDLFLLRGDPGSGKSRVVLEIIRQAILRGQRILFLSRTPAALDRVLSGLSRGGETLAIRFLQPGEDELGLHPEVRAVLLDSRANELARRAREAGNEELLAARQESLELDQASAGWPRLLHLLGQLQERNLQRQRLEAKLSRVDQELNDLKESPDNGDPGEPFARSWASWVEEAKRKTTAAEKAVAELERLTSECQSKVTQLGVENGSLEPLRRAWNGSHFWTVAWWQALCNPARVRKAIELADQAASASTQLEQHRGALSAALAERQRLAVDTATEQARVLQEERNRREKLLAADVHTVDAQIAELATLLHREQDRLPALAKYSLFSQNDIEQIHPDLIERKARAVAAVERAEQWLTLLDQTPHVLRDALIEHTPLVGATAAAWAGDRGLATRLSAQPFDVLILEEAEQFSEAQCASFARLARRWVLVGNDSFSEFANAPASQTQSDRRDVSAAGHPMFFAQLWQRLHANPERLPYSWIEEGNKLVCRLRPVAPEQRAWIETERLADHPQIVLHILALPRSRPVVAEVVFPATFTIQSAKQFILQELQELAVNASARSMRWHGDDSDRLVLQLAGQACQHAATVVLTPGVRELLSSREMKQSDNQSVVAWQTCCFEFDCQSGWHRTAAEDWIERYLGLRDLGRTCYLDELHRYSAGMASFVASVLALPRGLDSAAALDARGETAHAIEFSGVPSTLEPGHLERSPAPSRLRSAGFELDLSDTKNRERLPANLRAGLPAQGFVNLAEAQAIVRRLEDCLRAGSIPTTFGGAAGIFVIALYPVQAEIIRRLIKSSQALAAAEKSTIEVGVPQDFMHRDAPWVILSLTRSHAHRVGSYGSSLEDLLIALTRARHKLILFGDAGALSRRAHSDGVVERTDPARAARERSVVKMLVAHCHFRTANQTAVTGSEGHGS